MTEPIPLRYDSVPVEMAIAGGSYTWDVPDEGPTRRVYLIDQIVAGAVRTMEFWVQRKSAPGSWAFRIFKRTNIGAAGTDQSAQWPFGTAETAAGRPLPTTNIALPYIDIPPGGALRVTYGAAALVTTGRLVVGWVPLSKEYIARRLLATSVQSINVTDDGKVSVTGLKPEFDLQGGKSPNKQR